MQGKPGQGERSLQPETLPASAEAGAPVPQGERRDRGSRGDRRRDGAEAATGEARPRKEFERRDGPREGGKPREGAKGERASDRKGGGDWKGKDRVPREQGAKTYTARPPRAEKPIDPDSPFAVLAALKNRQ